MNNKMIMLLLLCLLLISCQNDLVEPVAESIEITIEEPVVEEKVEEEVVVEEEIVEEIVALKNVRILISALNARSIGSLDSEVIGSVYLNEIYEVYEYGQYDDWYKIILANNEFAWISAWYCRDLEYIIEDTAGNIVEDTLIVEILSEHTTVFTDYNDESEVIYNVNKDDRYKIIETYLNDDGVAWYKIRPSEDIIGWIKGDNAKEIMTNIKYD